MKMGFKKIRPIKRNNTELIIFSIIYYENKTILYNYWLHRCFDFEEIIKRISIMVKELLLHNKLIDYNEAVRILRKDNSEPLKIFSKGEIRRYIQ